MLLSIKNFLLLQLYVEKKFFASESGVGDGEDPSVYGLVLKKRNFFPSFSFQKKLVRLA